MSRQYLYTERTHLMCPNMNFGIVVEIRRPFDENRIRDTLSLLVHAHPFLTALLGYEEETKRFYYDITSESQVDLLIKEQKIAGLYDKSVTDEYERLVATDWDLCHEGMLKIVCWAQEDGLCLMFVFHHLLADGRGALFLANEFADYYVNGTMPAKRRKN